MRPDASAGRSATPTAASPASTTPIAVTADAGAMAAINEAYRVLGEPARRAVYDAALRGTRSGRALGTGAAATRRARHRRADTAAGALSRGSSCS